MNASSLANNFNIEKDYDPRFETFFSSIVVTFKDTIYSSKQPNILSSVNLYKV